MSLSESASAFQEALNACIKSFDVELSDTAVMTMRPLKVSEETEAHLEAVAVKKKYDDAMTYFYELKVSILARATIALNGASIEDGVKKRADRIDAMKALLHDVPTDVLTYLFTEWAAGVQEVMQDVGISAHTAQRLDFNYLPRALGLHNVDAPEAVGSTEGEDDTPETEKEAHTKPDNESEALPTEKDAEVLGNLGKVKAELEEREVKPLPQSIYNEIPMPADGEGDDE